MSTFRDAFVTQMTSNMDPMNGVVQQFAEKQIEVLDSQVVTTKGSVFERLAELKERLLNAEGEPDQEVLAGINRLLARASS